jgi:hypothetical protein
MLHPSKSNVLSINYQFNFSAACCGVLQSAAGMRSAVLFDYRAGTAQFSNLKPSIRLK